MLFVTSQKPWVAGNTSTQPLKMIVAPPDAPGEWRAAFGRKRLEYTKPFLVMNVRIGYLEMVHMICFSRKGLIGNRPRRLLPKWSPTASTPIWLRRANDRHRQAPHRG